MESYEIIRSERLKGKLRHTVRDRGKERIIDYFDIRMGLNWDPPFAVVAGEEHFDKLSYQPAHGQGILRVLDELQGDVLDLTEFFVRLSDAVHLHLVSDILADLSVEAFVEVYRDWSDRKGVSLGFQAAPYLDRVPAGISLIRSWDRDGLLELPEDTIVYEQLKALGEEALDDLPASLNALRFLVSGWQKYPPRREVFLQGPTPFRGHPQGWMA